MTAEGVENDEAPNAGLAEVAQAGPAEAGPAAAVVAWEVGLVGSAGLEEAADALEAGTDIAVAAAASLHFCAPS